MHNVFSMLNVWMFYADNDQSNHSFEETFMKFILNRWHFVYRKTIEWNVVEKMYLLKKSINWFCRQFIHMHNKLWWHNNHQFTRLPWNCLFYLSQISNHLLNSNYHIWINYNNFVRWLFVFYTRKRGKKNCEKMFNLPW